MFTHTLTHEGERTGPQDLNPGTVSERRSTKQQRNHRDSYDGEESRSLHRCLTSSAGAAYAVGAPSFAADIGWGKQFLGTSSAYCLLLNSVICLHQAPESSSAPGPRTRSTPSFGHGPIRGFCALCRVLPAIAVHPPVPLKWEQRGAENNSS